MSDDSAHSDNGDESTVPLPAQHDRRRLKRGDILGGRFAIVQFLAEGGMGEVYEAADLHLQNKHYALKTLRPEVAAKAELRLRFEREVLLAREVNHPNVCPTYDIFHAETPNGPMTFLTMKLLRGESLFARLKRLGRFELELLEPIAKQMADALDAAHRVGVIHRDFKPGNVMIDGSSADLRVSITDFGLSRAYEADATLAETGQVLGTPGYIAPELIHGRIAAFTADVYAFGVVLYEMATGQKPAYGGGKSNFAPPSTLAPDLPAVWDKLILGCLHQDPAKRFQSAGEAMAVLRAPKSSTWTTRVAMRSTSGYVWSALAVLVIVAALAGWVGSAKLNSFLHPLPSKRFVALMPWPADSNSSSLLKGVLDTVGSRLARAESSTKDFLVISAADVANASIKAPVDTIAALGANLVLGVSVQESTDQVVVHLAVLDAVTSKVLRSSDVRLSKSELSHIADRAAIDAAKTLDLDVANSGFRDPDDVSAVPPAAFQHFERAEDFASEPNDSHLDEAIEQYQKAIEVEPRFSLAYSHLSLAFARKFRRSEDAALLTLAERNADLALRFNPSSPQAMLSQAVVLLRSGKSKEALDGLQQALKLDPGNPQIPLYKGRLLRDLDRRAEAEVVYREIIHERPNFWPAYNELGISLWRQGQIQKAADVFAEGSAVAPRVFDLFTNRGSMLLLMGRTKEAEEAFKQSIERKPNAPSFSNLGTIAFGAKDYRKALDYYVKARDINPKDHTNWRNLGDCYAMLGDSAAERESYSKAAAVVSESLRTNPNRGAAWMDLAFYQAKVGDRDQSAASLQTAEQRGATDLPSQFKKVQVLALLGRKSEALTLLVDCVKKGVSVEQIELALDLKDLRNEKLYRDAIAEATHK